MAKPPRLRSTTGDIDKFLTRSKSLAQRANSDARLLFGIDATASRQPTWDRACHLQGEMFLATRKLGGLSVQLCYYRGMSELRSSKWLIDDQALSRTMRRVSCEGGMTQIERLLSHAIREHRKQAIKALVFIGDACEESAERLAGKAGELGMLGLPVFIFQEGHDARAEQVFKKLCALSNGAWARFDHSSAGQLAALLGAVASYAAGGREALLNHGRATGADVTLLLQQLNRD